MGDFIMPKKKCKKKYESLNQHIVFIMLAILVKVYVLVKLKKH